MINDSNCDKKVIRSIAKIVKKYRDCVIKQENIYPINFFA